VYFYKKMELLKFKILYVEDDINLSEVTKDLLILSGYDVTLCRDGISAYNTFKSDKFDVCIFDVMLPELDGFGLAEKVRQSDKNIPIIFLTAKNMKDDRVHGFKIGCDDYITKPFSSEELILRIEAIMKRCSNISAEVNKAKSKIYELPGLKFNYNEMQLIINGTQQKVTKKECDLLYYFFENKNKILPREDTLIAVWGNDSYFIGRSMDVFLTRLRKYLKDIPSVKLLNIHGVGYKFEIEE